MKLSIGLSVVLGLILSASAALAGEMKCSVADGSAQVDFKFDDQGNLTNYSLVYKKRSPDAVIQLEDFNLNNGGVNGFNSQIVYPDGEDVAFIASARDKVSTDADGTVHFNGYMNVFSDAPMSTVPATCTFTPGQAAN